MFKIKIYNGKDEIMAMIKILARNVTRDVENMICNSLRF